MQSLYRSPAACAAVLLLLASGAITACTGLIGADNHEARGDGEGGGGEGGESSVSGPGPASGSGVGAGASGPSSGSGAGTGGASSASSGGATCMPACGPNQVCEASTSTCVCSPGFVLQGMSCVPVPPGDPTTHTEQDVCDQWSKGHVVTEPDPVVASGAECDAGSLKQAALKDTLVRINMFRWLAGLGPTTDDASLNAVAQKCANLEAWWDFNKPQSPHSPPADSKCYTPEGASGAGQSNIAWGSGHPAQAIDQFMEDNGNATTMGHRRWIMNPPLNPVGIGYWEPGGQFGSAECLSVFGQSGGGPNPPWVAVPNPGFVPLTVATWTWTFHGSLPGIPNAQISILRVDDNMPLAVKVMTLQQGFGQAAISWDPNGWTPEADKTYRVTVSGLGGGDVVYDVKPINCK